MGDSRIGSPPLPAGGRAQELNRPASLSWVRRYRLTLLLAATTVLAISAAILVFDTLVWRHFRGDLVGVVEVAARQDAAGLVSMVNTLQGKEAVISPETGESSPGYGQAPLTLQALAAPGGLPAIYPGLLEGLDVVQLSLIDLNGDVVWSIDPDHIGLNLLDGPFVRKVLGGEAVSKRPGEQALMDEGTATPSADLIETYLPLRETPGGAVIGIIAVLKDVSKEAAHIEESRSAILRSMGATMGALFAVLLGFIVVADATMVRSNRRGLALMEDRLADRRVVESELRDSEERYRGFSEAAFEGVAMVQDGKIVEINHAFSQMLGYEAAEVVGKPVVDLVPPEPQGEISRKNGEEGDLGPYEGVAFKKDGSRIVLQISRKTIMFRGRDARVVALWDITEHKLMEEALMQSRLAMEDLFQNLEDRVRKRTAELMESNQRLIEAQDNLVRSERLAAIGHLAGGVAHDLRSPLGAVSNAVYYLKRRLAATELAKGNDRILQFLDVIDQEVQHCNQIITDLTGFARAGDFDLTPIDLAEVVRSGLEIVDFGAGVELDTEIDHGIVNVMGDSEQLRRVIINLVNNGCEAMPDGGRLTVSVRRAGGFVRLEVRDTGDGIADEHRPNIFDPLFTTKTQGTGLGLSICEKIIARHQGTIDVDSQLGRGATFIISIPLMPQESVVFEVSA